MHIFLDYIYNFFHFCINKGKHPNILKQVNITSALKKDYRGSAEGYRPLSILLLIIKILENLFSKQVTLFADAFLLKCQCVFWEGYVAQHCLLAKSEKWKQAVDNSQAFGTLLTDLSEASNSLPHELLITELNAHKFCLKALKLRNNYLSQTN